MLFSFRYCIVFMQDKKIVFDWLPPFDLLAKHKGLAAQQKKSSDKAELKKGEEKKELLLWWTYLTLARTSFEQELNMST